ncbi:uncharacterized protein LOC111863460 [Cryptotermes secundus]|uniref:uncharacterized protein LOC111863460 n=1 Tax=Cryptotermes secundus TaxID=105785 RepID=UPI000CD7BA22|nr:uncharacterized protein LOC111863460 [Cryptotermes secundus]XP_033606963.1 uncharacterized protein LOC111863460 [Cryptotermes secundus]XP_033606964.1 uncharacterized protein LOC111863460 [Cryptotermes secundus]XP_033606965.1 uncharacterized protein LOC111863460 [Cryptotermes secundus]
MIKIDPPKASDTRFLRKSQILSDTSSEEQHSSKSALDVLKEISHRRIHVQLDENEDDAVKRPWGEEEQITLDHGSDVLQVQGHIKAVLLSDTEKLYLKELLTFMSEEDLKMLARSIMENMIVPCTKQEAIDAILLHSATPSSLLEHDGMTRKILFRYLHSKRIFTVNANKAAMITKILQMWNGTLHHNLSTSVPVMDRHSTQPGDDVEGCEADELAFQFAQWFYSALNQNDRHCLRTQLYEHFWQKCKMQLVLDSEMGITAEAKNGADDVVKLICDTKIQHNLYFNPDFEKKMGYWKDS